jgi:hypothetical protein
MESVVSENTLNMLQGKDQKILINESAVLLNDIVPFPEEMLIEMVMNYSERFKQMSEKFDYDPKKCNASFSRDFRYVDLKDKSDNSILRVRLEEFIERDINHYISNLRID